MANLLWCIWKHRWKCIKEGQALDPSKTVHDAVQLSLNEISPNQDSNHYRERERKVDLENQHTLLMDGMVLINVDGGVRNNIGAATCVIRGGDGSFVRSRTHLENSSCVAFMEARAIELGMLEVKSLGINKVSIVSDALGIVQAINDGNMNFPWQARMIVQGIIHLQNEFEVCKINFIRRNHNEIADILVNVAFDYILSQSWENCPECIHQFVIQN